MKLSKNILILVTMIIMALLITACGNGSTAEESVVTEVSEVTEPESAEQDPVVEESETQSGESESPGSNELNVPEDIPLMEGYRKLLVTSDGSNISFEVDGTIDDVVTFYQTELENLGWGMSRSPDKTYAAFGALSREKENGDRITISLQHNPIGEFVVVRMVILRK